MKTKRTMKSIAAAALALTLVAAPAVQELSPLFSGTSVGIAANAANTIKCTAAELPAKLGTANDGDAIDVTDSGTLVLDDQILIDKSVTINLGKATIKPASDYAHPAKSGEAGALIRIAAQKTVVINGGTITGGYPDDVVFDNYIISVSHTPDSDTTKNGQLTLKGTTVVNNSGENASDSRVTNSSLVRNYGVLTLDGATVKSISDAAAVKSEELTTTTITNGTVIEAKTLGATNWGTMTVDGGSKVTAGLGAFNNLACVENATTLSISDATIKGHISVGGDAAVGTAQAPSITIGSGAVLEDFAVIKNGSYPSVDFTAAAANTINVSPEATITLRDTYEVAADSALKAGFDVSNLGVSPDGTVKASADATADILAAAKAKVEAFLPTYKIASGDGEAAIATKLKNDVIDADDDAGRLSGVSVTVVAVSDKTEPTTEADGSWTVNITLTENGTNARINNVELTIPELLTNTEEYDKLVAAIDDKIADIKSTKNIENASTNNVADIKTPIESLDDAGYSYTKIGTVTITTTTSATATEAGVKTVTVPVDTKDAEGNWVIDSADDKTYTLPIMSHEERVNKVKADVEALVEAAMDDIEKTPSVAATIVATFETAVDTLLADSNTGVTRNGTITYTAPVTTPGSEAPATITSAVKLQYTAGSYTPADIIGTDRTLTADTAKLNAAAEAVKPLLKAYEATNDTTNDDLADLTASVQAAAAKTLGVTAGSVTVDIQDEATEEATGLAMLSVTLTAADTTTQIVTVGVVIPMTAEADPDEAKVADAKPIVNAYLEAISITKDTDSAKVEEQIKNLVPEGTAVKVTITPSEDGKTAAVSAEITSGEAKETIEAKTKPIETASSAVEGDANGDGEVNALDIRFILRKLGY